jgi:hypothetical protein
VWKMKNGLSAEAGDQSDEAVANKALRVPLSDRHA